MTEYSSFPELLTSQVERTPDALAAVCDHVALSYGELEKRVNQLAQRLCKLGVGPEVLVGLFVERSLEMLIGICGIGKAGGAYLPLDPTYPQDRLAFMLADAGVPLVLTQEHLVERLPVRGTPVLCLDRDWASIQHEPAVAPRTSLCPENLAYVIYTSGSTGTPKGIAIKHQGIINNLVDLNRRFSVGPADKILALSSLSFDMCVYETLGMLVVGGTIVLPTEREAKDPALWNELLIRHQVTLWNSAPALLDLLVKHLEQSSATLAHRLRLALLGGDWIPLALPDRLKAFVPGIQVVSLGGATEASIHSTIYPIETRDPNWRSIPYGRPMANQQAYILDASQQLTPIGVPGELHLGGVGLARGYLNRPDLTAAKFVPHPSPQAPGERLYKTGDLARYLPDGTIELLGRMDFLMKLHGLRIEPGEIEAYLKQHLAVQDSIVLVREDTAGDKYLVAYVVLKQEVPPPSTAELRHFLARKLPEYMLPAITMVLEALPVTPNGKVDRLRLPVPDQAKRRGETVFVPPRDSLEMKLASIWSSDLKIDRIGIDDNFFELGGDSFKAIRAVRAFGDTLPVIELFKHPTIRELAEYLRTACPIATELLYQLTTVQRDTKLTLVCIPYGGGNVVTYQPLADALADGYALYSVALPGHDFACRTEPLLSLQDTAKLCIEKITEKISGPIVLYGHCAGVVLTLEIARLLEETNRSIEAIYLGAALPDQEPLQSMERGQTSTYEEMYAYLRLLGGFEEVLDSEEMKYIVGVVRHDLVNWATYFAQPLPMNKLKAPLYCVVGDRDAATKDYAHAYHEWEAFSEQVQLIVIPEGRHYFVKHQVNMLADLIVKNHEVNAGTTSALHGHTQS